MIRHPEAPPSPPAPEKAMQLSALITGITGQDGSYLAELLLEKGYTVHGLVRPHGRENLSRIQHLMGRVQLHEGDLADQATLTARLRSIRPREVYNLAAQTFIPASWQQPIMTTDATALGVVRLLEAIRAVDARIRLFQASSSEMFGDVDGSPQNESTPFRPRNPYATSKVYGHWIMANYRQHYGIFACSGIMFNHESPRRSEDFVSRKITRTAAEIKLGMAGELRLGNLQARRDWGFAGDYVVAMWKMLQQGQPEDYVIGTGQTHRVQDFVAAAFSHLDLDWREYVVIDPEFYRPAEPNVLVADPRKARLQLGWKPRVGFNQLVAMMVDADMQRLQGRPVTVKHSEYAA